MVFVQKQLIPISFNSGVNTKPDPKQLQAGQLLTLQNGQFSKTSQINKRYGYDLLNNTIEGGGNISAGIAIKGFRDELVLFDGNNVYSYLSGTGNWSNRGTAISIITNDNDVIRVSDAQQLNPDAAYLNGMELYAWEDSRGGVRYSTRDYETKAFEASDQLVNISGQQPKCISFQNQVFIFYSDGTNNLYYRLVNPYNPTVIQSAIHIVSDGYAGSNGFPYDACVIGNQLFVGYLSDSTATGAIQVFYLNSGFVKSSTTIVDNTAGQAINNGFNGAVNVVGDSANNAWISWADGIKVRTSCYSSTLTQVLAPTIIDTANSVVLTGIESPTPLTLLLCYEVYNAIGYNEQVRYATVSPAGNVSSPITIRSVGLASKCFAYQSNIYVNVAYQSTLQSTDFTYIIANSSGLFTSPVIVAKETPSVGGGLQTNPMCPETVSISAGAFLFANLEAGKIISEANTLFSIFGVNATSLAFTPSDQFQTVTQDNTLLIVGGILQGYDGLSVTELGFNLYPENITYTPAGSDGSLSTGTYLYAVTYEWTDNFGQIYRSAPSVASSVVVSATNHVTIVIPTLRLTAKTGTRANCSIVIYRSAANGSTLNRVTSTTAPTLNNPLVDTVTFVDILSDADAQSNELLYTTGNVLNNIAPPANSIITTYGDRVFLAGLSDKLLTWYSQTVVDNSNANTIPPQFCAELTISVDPRGGDITALGLLNGALVIFKETEIFALSGNGPDATGNQSDFGDPQLITSDVGCINANSVSIMPSGLMFQSAKGIYLLDQSSNLTYIGAPVEAFNSYTITSSVLSADSNQVIFTTSQGTSLVYDYYQSTITGQPVWSTWTNQYAEDCTIFNNTFCFLTDTGQVYKQNSSKFTDNDSPVYLSFTTPNLSFAGIQGYQRVFRCFILGTFKSPHSLVVNVAYDFNDTYTQTTTINANSLVSTWGSDASWGSSSPWGGEYQIYEFRVDFSQQKCTAIRLQISDSQSSNYGEGYAISAITFEVGILPSGNRLPPSSTYGAK